MQPSFFFKVEEWVEVGALKELRIRGWPLGVPSGNPEYISSAVFQPRSEKLWGSR